MKYRSALLKEIGGDWEMCDQQNILCNAIC